MNPGLTTYRLDGDTPVIEPDFAAWCLWFYGQGRDHHLAETWVGDVRVSTVFLGVDPIPRPDGRPLLWETLIDGGESDGVRDQYASAAEARRGHEEAVASLGVGYSFSSDETP